MNKKKTTIFCLLLALIFILSGCQLAKEDLNEPTQTKDRLAGVFLTTTWLDLFDSDRYIEENLSAIMNGREISAARRQQYEGRLYAKMVPSDNGRPHDFIFENVEGIRYFSAYVSVNGEEYHTLISDPGIVGGGTHIKTSDEGESIEFSGTLYLWPQINKTTTYYVNPVYQQADGQIYCVKGNGWMIDSSSVPGASITTTLTDSVKTTVNGETKAYTASCAMSIDTMYRPEKIAVLQMDANGQLLSRQEYAPEALPDEMVLDAGVAFLIGETQAFSPEGEMQFTRALYQPGDASFSAFYAREDGLCIPVSVSLLWLEK